MDQNSAATPTKIIAIILGSKNDWPKVQQVISEYTADKVRIVVHVISCHRNPYEVVAFAEGSDYFDAVICVGGKAFALPGVLDAFIHANGKKTPVIGVALGKADATNEGLAALLSIEQLPGQPVIMDGQDPYLGPEGLGLAIEHVIANRLPAPKERQEKPAELEIYKNFDGG